MSDQWIEGCVVQRIMFRDGLVLNFDDYNELVVKAPFQLTVPPTGDYPAEAEPIDPLAVRDEERPLFDFSGETCTYAYWTDSGDLHLEFTDGHVIDVPHHDRETAWELYGKNHGYAACLPGGKLRVVRHDLPEEEASP